MHILLGALLGAAAAAALQAVAVAYLVGLLIAAALLGALPVLVATVASPPRPTSHWLRRPLAQGAVLAAGTAASLALSVRLLGSGGDDVHFVRPLLPGLAASVVELVLLAWLAVRGARGAREAVRSDQRGLRAGARSLALLAARAACRALALVVLGAAFLALLAGAGLGLRAGGPGGIDAGIVILGAFVAFLVGGLGCLLAWWGRRRSRVPR